jgi:ATP phosphoribosyltransferase regulatory subunit HisZ
MTKAFLEKMVLKPENEKLVLEAFSKKSLKKVKEFDSKRAAKLKKTSDRKLSINDLAILN